MEGGLQFRFETGGGGTPLVFYAKSAQTTENARLTCNIRVHGITTSAELIENKLLREKHTGEKSVTTVTGGGSVTGFDAHIY